MHLIKFRFKNQNDTTFLGLISQFLVNNIYRRLFFHLEALEQRIFRNNLHKLVQFFSFFCILKVYCFSCGVIHDNYFQKKKRFEKFKNCILNTCICRKQTIEMISKCEQHFFFYLNCEYVKTLRKVYNVNRLLLNVCR